MSRVGIREWLSVLVVIGGIVAVVIWFGRDVDFTGGDEDLDQYAEDACDPAYPTVCIASPPPVLACSNIKYRRFLVLRPDPHGFDRDRDGIGCESG